MSFADKVISYNKQLDFCSELPPGIRVMNPYKESPQVITITEQFYRKFYNDDNKRHIILGINPGRFGGGVTGIPFTDSKRLKSIGIDYDGKETHEPSSVFVYDFIAAFGGAERFYQHFYINSVCPLGFTSTGKNGKEINYNYYDDKALTAATYDFIIENLKKQIDSGINTDTCFCFCFGNGKNEKFLRKMNDEHHFFKKIIALEHPRFIVQYKSKTKQQYIDKYIAAFESVL
jgi:hypothetical protein